MKFKRGIHGQLLFIYALVTLAVFMVAGSLWAYANYQTHKHFFEQRIHSQAELVAKNIGAALLFYDVEASGELVLALEEETAITSLVVKRIDGEIIHDLFFVTHQQQASTSGWESLFGHSELKEFVLPVDEAGEKLAVLIVRYHEGELRDTLIESIKSLLLVLCIAFVMGVFLTSIFQRSITSPIIRLAQVARRVSDSGDYSQRSEESFRYEVADLAKAFNNMLGLIETREKNLESLVDERTSMLMEKNNELQTEVTEHAKSEQARQEIEALFEQAFNNAPSGMLLIDSSRHIIRSNAMCEHFIVMGSYTKSCLDELITEDYRAAVIELVDKLVSGQVPQFKVEASCLDRRDDKRLMVISGAPVYDTENNYSYAIISFQDITELRKLSNRLDYQAHHDQLTGLPNRRMLNSLLEELKNGDLLANQQHALCFIDLDLFKTVNDTCGHSAGDELLRQISDLIRLTVRRQDYVIRLGGDEFALLLTECSPSEVKQIANNVCRAVAKHQFIWDDRTFRTSTSIGAIFIGNDFDAQQALQQVDAACYEAKEMGGNRVHAVEVDSPDIIDRQSQMNWVQRIRRAIEKDEFVLYGQRMLPVSRDENSQFIEILLRMQDPDDPAKIIPPGAFMPAAERYGLVTEIDQWVVCKLLAELPRLQRIYGDDCAYWVNLSGTSIGDSDFVAFLEQTLSEAKVPASMVNFEITETSVVKNLSIAREAILRLKEQGCRFALDDFGAGMASFGYLENLPVDFIKIDGMFISSIHDSEVNAIFVETIVKVAEVLGMKTIAEYIEDDRTLQKVTELGVDYAQGFGIHKPCAMLPDDCELGAVVVNTVSSAAE